MRFKAFSNRPAPAAHLRPIPEQDLVLLRDRYVALDDALCLVRLTTLLDRYRKPYRIRAERSTSFADMRDTPSVLIGAFDNPWTRAQPVSSASRFARTLNSLSGPCTITSMPEFAVEAHPVLARLGRAGRLRDRDEDGGFH